MGRYLMYRLMSAIPILLIVSLVSFLIIFLVPGDPASEIAGAGATADEVARIRQSLGLDQHVGIQMLTWYGNLLQGDLGQSILLHRSVTVAILERAPVTLSLTLLALTISLSLALVLGIAAAVKQNTWVDQSSMTVALLGLSF